MLNTGGGVTQRGRNWYHYWQKVSWHNSSDEQFGNIDSIASELDILWPSDTGAGRWPKFIIPDVDYSNVRRNSCKCTRSSKNRPVVQKVAYESVCYVAIKTLFRKTFFKCGKIFVTMLNKRRGGWDCLHRQCGFTQKGRRTRMLRGVSPPEGSDTKDSVLSTSFGDFPSFLQTVYVIFIIV